MSRKETGEAGWAGLGSAGLDHSSRLWGTGPIPGCLVPALGDEGRGTVVQSGGAPWRRGWGVGSGLAGLHMKGTLTGELFTIARNWLTLGEQSLQGLQAPKIAKHQKDRIKYMINTQWFSLVSLRELLKHNDPRPTESDCGRKR